MSSVAAINRPSCAVDDAITHPWWRFGATSLAHTTVDFFAYLFIPIMSVLEGRLDLSPREGAIILGIGSVASGFIQPVVAWLGDRFDTRLLASGAMAIAVIAISLVGYANNFEQLLLIQIIGTAGIGAFHPAAAAAIGQLSGTKRSLGVSIFFFAGMAGGVGGNVLSPILAKHFGLERYIVLIIPGLLATAGLTWAIARVPHRHRDAHTQTAAWSSAEASMRWFAIGVLYVGNILRFTVNMMLVQLVIRSCEQIAMANAHVSALDAAVRTSASSLNGTLQGAMQIGMAAGGLSAGAFLKHHHERVALIVVPGVGAGAIFAFPHAQLIATQLGNETLFMLVAFLLAMVAGIGFAGMIPVTISLAQRILPHRTALASGLMMGGAWGFAAVGPSIAQWSLERWGIDQAYAITAGFLLLAGMLSMALPGKLLNNQVSPH